MKTFGESLFQDRGLSFPALNGRTMKEALNKTVWPVSSPNENGQGKRFSSCSLRGKAPGCGPIVANIHNSLSLFASQKGINIFLEVVQFTGRVIALRRSRRIVHIQRWPCKKTISVQWNWRTKKSIITINSRVILTESV